MKFVRDSGPRQYLEHVHEEVSARAHAASWNSPWMKRTHSRQKQILLVAMRGDEEDYALSKITTVCQFDGRCLEAQEQLYNEPADREQL
jgi:hypothetical protein